jgi:phthiocerol/phenolphthiocerol synthesis type-I polyketide synthase C
MNHPDQDPRQLIAIVGMSARLPGADDLNQFWQLLSEGREAIRDVPEIRWDVAEQLDPEKDIQSVGGFLDGVELFDPTFFGISPREAEDVDPQQRLFLEAAWRALEDAGIPAASLAGTRTGVYVGASWHDYELLRKDRGASTTQHSAVGNALDMVAARVSYFLKLNGPSLVVETGCSSALVALHTAAQSLRSGDVDSAIVGGVNLILAPDVSVGLTHFGGLSPTGRCHAFSADADGFVRGEGIVALYLKTLEQAVADGDRIRAVIVGTAVNNDGGGESLVTPNPDGQQKLLQSVYARAGLDPAMVDYVEAHGTGTKRGDPIEVSAIGHVLGQRRAAGAGPVSVGSVKTNIGHLEAAAGLAGLAKVVLAIQHREIPATLHAERLNPEIDFEALNVRVVRQAQPMPADRPLYMGVNSFGWGGTNAHAILCSAPEPAARTVIDTDHRIPAILTVSAQTEDALRTRAEGVSQALAEIPLTELAGGLAHQRDHFPVRLATVATDADNGMASLRRYLADPEDAIEVITGRAKPVGRIAFVFPGQGSQSAEMGKHLIESSPMFAAVIDRCNAALAPHVDWDLVELLTGKLGEAWLERIDMVQPALWAVTLGLAELWRAAGIHPDVVVGHSQGEITAATVAGMLSYEDAALIMARRSAIARRTSGFGRMMAVELDLQAAHESLAGFEDTVSVAANNGPRSCLLSGETDSILVLKEILEADEVYCRLVNVDYASHSPQMDALRPDLLVALGEISPHTGQIEMVSTVHRRPVDGTELDAGYWADNLRQPVLFADVLDGLLENGVTHVVEISPHPVIAPAVEQLAQLRDEPAVVLSTMRRELNTTADFATALARAYAGGLSPFGLLDAGRGTAVIPGYPWQQTEFWVTAHRRRSVGAELAITLIPAATGSDLWTGDLELGTGQSPWLADHQVHEAVVVPGAAMLTLALAAGRARTGADPRSIRNFQFRSDLTLGEEPANLQVQLRDDITAGASFRLMSLPAGSTSWTEHATGRLAFDGEPLQLPDFPANLLLAETSTPEDFYAGCRGRGLQYGPAFQSIQRLQVTGSEALGELDLSSRCRTGTGTGALHPALWDGVLQVSLALFAGEHAVVPVRVARIELHSPLLEPIGQVWSHAVRRGPLSADVHVFDSAQRPLLSMYDLSLQELSFTSADKVESRYVRLEFGVADAPDRRTDTGSWLVVGDPSDELADALRERGVSRLNTAAHDDSELASKITAHSEIAWFMPGKAAGLAAQQDALMQLANVIRTATAQPTPVHLNVITTVAQAGRPEDELDPGAGLAWGFVRVARREHGELEPRLIDIAAEDGWATACADELLAGDGEDQVILRGTERRVGRLVAGAAEEALAEPAPVRWQGPRQPFRLHPARPGLWEGLEFRPLARRAPQAGEIEVEVEATGLNFIDVMKAVGSYPDPVGGSQLGGECAGRVTAVGEAVHGFKPGDRVVACVFGAAASHVTVPAGQAALIPAHLSIAQAAGLPLVLSTAWYGLVELADLADGETVLIHSATGGLGLAAIAVARQCGATVIATAGSPAKRDHLRSLGIEHVFDSRDLSWAEQVREVTAGRGVDVVLNSLTGAAIPLGLDVLAEDGRFIEVGKLDIYADRSIGLGAFRRSITLASLDLAGLMDRRPQRFHKLLAAAWEQVCTGAIAPLPVTEYPMVQAAEALREMSRGAHIGKFVLTDPGSVVGVVPEPLRDGQLRGDSSYLITGGLGALGLSLAELLAERGAGDLVLVGRSAPNDQAAQRIEALRAAGTTVHTHQSDISDANAVSELLEGIRQYGRPLRGIVHAAGLLDDATIANVTATQLRRVLAPKIAGALNLDAASAEDSLDFFVTFSSAAALVGNTGQAAYAAANAAMDSLVTARRRRGLAGLSVQWGPFAEIGLAAEDDNRGSRLSERGMGSFTVDEAWPALLELLDSRAEVVGYLPLNLRQWFEAYPETAAQPSWSTLRQASLTGETTASGTNDFVASLQNSPEPERLELVQAMVNQLVGRVLRLDPKTVDHETPFKALGLDSLMGLELRNRLEATFALRLSPTLLWTYGSTKALSGQLCQRLVAEDVAAV